MAEQNLQEIDPKFDSGHSDLKQVRVSLEKNLPQVIDAVKKIGSPAAEKVAKDLEGLADDDTATISQKLKRASEALSKEWSDEFDKQFDAYKKEISDRLDAHVEKGVLTPAQKSTQLKDSLSQKRSDIKRDLEGKYMNPVYFIRSLSNVQGSKLSWSNVGSKRTEKDLYTTKTAWGKPPEVVDRITKKPADKPMSTAPASDMDDFVARLRAHKTGQPARKPASRGTGGAPPKPAKAGPTGWNFDKKPGTAGSGVLVRKKEDDKEKKEVFQRFSRIIESFASGRDSREPNWDLLEVLL